MNRAIIRYSAFAGLTTLALAATVTWFVVAEASPLREFFLYDGVDLKNTWGYLNLPSVLAGAIVAGNPHAWNGTAMAVMFLLQWFLIGFVPTFLIATGYRRAAAAH